MARTKAGELAKRKLALRKASAGAERKRQQRSLAEATKDAWAILSSNTDAPFRVTARVNVEGGRKSPRFQLPQPNPELVEFINNPPQIPQNLQSLIRALEAAGSPANQ